VIDGVLNPSLWSSGLQILSDRNAATEVAEEFHRLCDEAKTNCPFWRREGSKARFEALVEAVRKAPVVLPDEPPYRYDQLIGDVVGFLYAPEVWNGDEGLAAFLASLSDAVEGRPGAAAQAQALRAALKAKLKREEPVEPYNNAIEAYLAVYCTDGSLPRSLEGFSQIDDLLGTRYGQLWWWAFNAACATWPAGEDRYTGPWSARTSSPVLIVGNRFDPSTGYDGALASSRLLPNSRLLTYAGWGHTAFNRSACATDAILSYLKDGTLPKEGTVCPANENPFESVPSALSRQQTVSIVGRPPAFPFFR
jgi:hypothetical protein